MSSSLKTITIWSVQALWKYMYRGLSGMMCANEIQSFRTSGNFGPIVIEIRVSYLDTSVLKG